MTRLSLNPCAEHGNAANTFKVAIIVTASYAIFSFIMRTMLSAKGMEASDPIPPEFLWPILIIGHIVGVYFLVLVIKTRMHIRRKYQIPTGCCGCLEDCCCAFVCACCAISQMGRHTTDYSTHTAYCCSRTGLSPNVPLLDDIEQSAQPLTSAVML